VALKWSEWDEEEGKTEKGGAPAPAPAPAAPLAPPAHLNAEQRARLHVGSPGVAADPNFVEESWD
jgi:hypothetical protein